MDTSATGTAYNRKELLKKWYRLANEGPTTAEVLAALPPHLYEKSLPRSLAYAALSVTLTVGTFLLAYLYLPVSWSYLPLWIVYAVLCGTFGTGCWVIAHECGHNAFCNQQWLQDAIGYVLHSAMLVPYFSWQRSHAVHHSRTNHLTEGETHVPNPVDSKFGQRNLNLHRVLGDDAFAIYSVFTHLALGWPAYLLWGATGGPVRGRTNHFVPSKPFSDALFNTDRLKRLVYMSDVGCLVTLAILAVWGIKCGSWMRVMALYGGPYLVVNAWLVAYTWLQHTDDYVPHLDESNWTWIKGAFLTVDRPYGPVLNLLHHHIGSSHVAHHIVSRIPHYHAVEATKIIKAKFPQWYHYDDTPIWQALWRVAKQCVAVQKEGPMWVFTTSLPEKQE